MIVAAIMLFVTGTGIYTLSYGIHLAKKEKNALAAFGAILLAILTIAAPALLIIYRY